MGQTHIFSLPPVSKAQNPKYIFFPLLNRMSSTRSLQVLQSITQLFTLTLAFEAFLKKLNVFIILLFCQAHPPEVTNKGSCPYLPYCQAFISVGFIFFFFCSCRKLNVTVSNIFQLSFSNISYTSLQANAHSSNTSLLMAA